MLKKFLSSERGATELTSQIFILLGVATIIAALIIIFRTQLTEIVNNMFANFGTRSGSTW